MPKKFDRYIEPFAGSACLFFDVEPKEAVLGDLNQELVLTYQMMQRNLSLVIECVKRFPTGKRGYYKVRNIDIENLSLAERAARFLYLNHYCFNGIYRTNLRGDFNVPYGPPKSGRKIDLEKLRECAKCLQATTVIQGDFERTLSFAKRGDFVYLDPPYAVTTRRIFKEYGPKHFSPHDLSRLSTVLCNFDRRGIKFMISYADSPEARKMVRPWNSQRVMTRRHIAGFSGARRTACELLATNY